MHFQCFISNISLSKRASKYVTRGFAQRSFADFISRDEGIILKAVKTHENRRFFFFFFFFFFYISFCGMLELTSNIMHLRIEITILRFHRVMKNISLV